MLSERHNPSPQPFRKAYGILMGTTRAAVPDALGGGQSGTEVPGSPGYFRMSVEAIVSFLLGFDGGDCYSWARPFATFVGWHSGGLAGYGTGGPRHTPRPIGCISALSMAGLGNLRAAS